MRGAQSREAGRARQVKGAGEVGGRSGLAGSGHRVVLAYLAGFALL